MQGPGLAGRGGLVQVHDHPEALVPHGRRVLLVGRGGVSVVEVHGRTGRRQGGDPHPGSQVPGPGVVQLDLVGNLGEPVRGGEQQVPCVAAGPREQRIAGVGDRDQERVAVEVTRGDSPCDRHLLAVRPPSVVPRAALRKDRAQRDQHACKTEQDRPKAPQLTATPCHAAVRLACRSASGPHSLPQGRSAWGQRRTMSVAAAARARRPALLGPGHPPQRR